jgi:hypothetical protein
MELQEEEDLYMVLYLKGATLVLVSVLQKDQHRNIDLKGNLML